MTDKRKSLTYTCSKCMNIWEDDRAGFEAHLEICAMTFPPAIKRKPWTPIEIRFHHALPGWCKLIGLRIREIPECEGGGYMIPEADARLYAEAPAMADLIERVAIAKSWDEEVDNKAIARALLAKIRGGI